MATFLISASIREKLNHGEDLELLRIIIISVTLIVITLTPSVIDVISSRVTVITIDIIPVTYVISHTIIITSVIITEQSLLSVYEKFDRLY